MKNCELANYPFFEQLFWCFEGLKILRINRIIVKKNTNFDL